jgi:hypothetical protein
MEVPPKFFSFFFSFFLAMGFFDWPTTKTKRKIGTLEAHSKEKFLLGNQVPDLSLNYRSLGSVSTLTKQIITCFLKMNSFKKIEIIIIFIIYYNIVI